MRKLSQLLLAIVLLWLGVYFSKNDPLGNKPAVAAETSVDLFSQFHLKAQKANALLVAFDDDKAACLKDKAKISNASHQLRSQLDALALQLMNKDDFSTDLQKYISECAKDCSCSSLSVFEMHMMSNPAQTEKFKEELEKIKLVIEKTRSETTQERLSCANQLGDLCALVNSPF